jgi:excisionase family DNA binding protein
MAKEQRNINSGEGLQDRVTIRQAAALLGVHPNTVRKRVKEGVYEAEKVSTEHGFTWLIHRNTLLNTPPTRDTQIVPQQFVGNADITPETLVQGMLRPFVEDLGRVREELGAERVRREQAECERDELAAELEALRETRGALETVAEDVSANEIPPEQQEPLQRRSSWWRRFFGFE